MPNFSFPNIKSEIVANSNLQQHLFVIKGTIITGIKDSEVVFIPAITADIKKNVGDSSKKNSIYPKTLKKLIAGKVTPEEKKYKTEFFFSSVPLQSPLSISKGGDKTPAINTITKYGFEKAFLLFKSTLFNLTTINGIYTTSLFSKETINTSLLQQTAFARPPPLSGFIMT